MKYSKIKTNALSAIILITSFNLQAAEEVKSSEWSGNISAYIGQKSLKEEDWNTLDSQSSLGILFDIKKRNWPVSLAFDVIVSGDVNKTDSMKETGGTVEYDLGVRKIFDSSGSKLKPYIGGGMAVIFSEMKNETDSNLLKEKKDATGLWVGVGAYYEITPKLNLGMDVRYSKAQTTLFDEEREIGGLNAGLTFGYNF